MQSIRILMWRKNSLRPNLLGKRSYSSFTANQDEHNYAKLYKFRDSIKKIINDKYKSIPRYFMIINSFRIKSVNFYN